jgi:hypothetical protein
MNADVEGLKEEVKALKADFENFKHRQFTMMKPSDRDTIKSGLLTVLCNATGIFRRTIVTNKDQYKKKLREIIIRLTRHIDDGSITNSEIREAIKELGKVSPSIGASQKVINVYLKYYAVVSNKSDAVLNELDCPIDSFVIKENGLNSIGKKHGRKGIALTNLKLEPYEEMQHTLGQRYGMKILADVEAWDSKKAYKIGK